ncbi:MAG: MFS transporter [Endozoicomonadaceae bacterium]|nr:MFS transporter [Endozoicomonadaceae bacterium]
MNISQWLRTDIMNQSEFFSVISLSFVSASRILGLCMLLPVLPLYASHFGEASPMWIGFALGIYGFPQAILQIPAGRLSDRYGRKPIIIAGLIIFLIGTLIAAFSNTIIELLIGRFLQGSGAISSSIVALITDLVRPNERAKGMAVFGITIGLSFCLAMIIGPFIAATFNIIGIFGLTAILACISLIIIQYIVPNVPRNQNHPQTIVPIQVLLKTPQVLILSIGAFILHLTLISLFTILPTLLRDRLDIPLPHHGSIYCILLVLAFLAMIPFIVLGEKKHCLDKLIIYMVSLLALSTAWIAVMPTDVSFMLIGAWVYFFAFNFLEASLPAILSQKVPISSKGSALGIYSSCQFLGAGMGGVLSGILLEFTTYQTIMMMCSLFSLLWLISAYSIQKK